MQQCMNSRGRKVAIAPIKPRLVIPTVAYSNLYRTAYYAIFDYLKIQPKKN